MPFARQKLVRAPSPRLLIAAGVAVTVVLCGCAGLAVAGLRKTAWQQANIGAETLLDSLTRTLTRDFELYDLSLQAVADRLRDPILEGVSPQVRHLALFDRAATASGYGAIFVLDAQGDAFIDSGSLVPRRLNGADRVYFQVQRGRDAGLYVGRPWRTRVSGREMIPLSRRFAYADGTFAGVVVGAIELAYFEAVFARLNRNLNLKITVLFDDSQSNGDGQVPVQYPAADPLDRQTLAAIAKAEHISLIAPLAGAEALHLAHRVGTLPMHVVVSVPLSTIASAWHARATAIVLIVGTLALALLCLLQLLRSELQRRAAAEAELAALALTDALTGIPNRRHFDQRLAELERATSRARFALALIDVDRFKAFNDHSGHPAGDRVLKAVGAELELCAAAAGGIAFRVGGEEFAIVLVGVDKARALEVARCCRRSIAALALPHELSPLGIVTVSVGLLYADRQFVATQAEWLSLADAALYEAKRGGRDQVRMIEIIDGRADHSGPSTKVMEPEELSAA
ncbi:diguanylate cyclase domain-containing protein [Methylobacterium sp. C33D]